MPEEVLSHAEALAFAERCGRTGIVILGLERFVRSPGGIRPDLDGIADFSMEGRPGDPVQTSKAAMAFLNLFGRDPDEGFAFVLDDPV